MEGTRLLRDNERATTNTAIDQSASWEDPGPPSGHYIELRNQAQGRVSEAQLEPSPLTSSSPSLYETGGSNGGRGKPPVYTTVQGRHQGHVPSSRSKCGHPDWFWETLSIVVAIVALAAMVITLVLHRDRPLPNWPFAITINALVAVFSAILKACLVMPIAECISQLKWLWFQKPRPLNQIDQWDLASRGPWGSFLLIFKVRGRDLAVLGAILTVAAMAVDPFVQQIVQLYNCSMVVDGEVSMVPFSNNYTDGTAGRPTGTPDLDSQMQSAIYVGLLDPPANVSAALAYRCRTGNCTFAATDDGATLRSLALQSQCVDISNNISYSINTTEDTSNDNKTYSYSSASLLEYEISLDDQQPYVMQSGNLYAGGWPSSFLNKVSFLMAPNTEAVSTNSTLAFECEFFPAVATYAINITNGVLVEHVLDIQRMDVWSAPWATHSLLLVNKTIRDGLWHECKGLPDPSDNNTMPIVSFPTAPGPIVGTSYSTNELTNKSTDGAAVWNYTTWWAPDCVYWLPYVPAYALSATLDEFLGNETLYFDSWTSRAQGNLWSVNLWNNGSATVDTVQKAMTGLADSVTARWRTGDGISVNVGPLQGTVWENQTCVRVNWAWIALPAVLVLLTIVFLMLTIGQTRLQHGLVWKSSSLALLFNGLDEKTRESSGPVMRLQEMKSAADKAVMQLRETGDGFRLVTVEKETQ